MCDSNRPPSGTAASAAAPCVASTATAEKSSAGQSAASGIGAMKKYAINEIGYQARSLVSHLKEEIMGFQLRGAAVPEELLEELQVDDDSGMEFARTSLASI